VIVVAGSVRVDAEARDAYLDGCREVVAAAREAPGCLDFALSADLLEPDRINVFERWESASLREIRVSEYQVRKADL
jgi:quinol monooxygenase YgiN